MTRKWLIISHDKQGIFFVAVMTSLNLVFHFVWWLQCKFSQQYKCGRLRRLIIIVLLNCNTLYFFDYYFNTPFQVPTLIKLNSCFSLKPCQGNNILLCLSLIRVAQKGILLWIDVPILGTRYLKYSPSDMVWRAEWSSLSIIGEINEIFVVVMRPGMAKIHGVAHRSLRL